MEKQNVTISSHEGHNVKNVVGKMLKTRVLVTRWKIVIYGEHHEHER
jgi:hypothetical protein